MKYTLELTEFEFNVVKWQLTYVAHDHYPLVSMFADKEVRKEEYKKLKAVERVVDKMNSILKEKNNA